MDAWSAPECDCEQVNRRMVATIKLCGSHPMRCPHDFRPINLQLRIRGVAYDVVRCRHCGQSERRVCRAA